ncbi:MAG TPA: pilin [Candidatus Saccharimonadales bacterium]
MKKLKATIAVFIVSLLTVTTLATPSFASVFGDACKGKTDAVCSQVNTGPANTNTFIQNVIGTLIFAVGVISVIMIVIGGIRYATSDGDSGKVKSAKDTILYSVVGLVVALLSYAIVGFVFTRF